jgi:uncharacterized protein (DUF1697 family)
MKATHVALLRGINVGGNSKVFEELGFTNVSTYINSGNVMFQTDKTDLAKKITAAIKKELKLDLKVLVKEAKEIKKICAKIPKDWTNDKGLRTDVIFLFDEYDKKDALKRIKTNPDVDTLLYVPGAIIWHLDRKNYTKSRMNKFIGTEVYKNSTARNVNTTKKLLELLL